MPIVLRFYGRFVFVEHTVTVADRPVTELAALAVNMRYNTEVPADEHRVFMTAASRLSVNPTGSGRTVNWSPSFRVVVGTDHSVWDLAGRDVTLEGSGFEWRDASDRQRLADLSTLAPGGKLDPSCLNHVGGPVQAIIRLRTGIGETSQLQSYWRYQFVTIASPRSPIPGIPPRQLADRVDVHLPEDYSLNIGPDGQRFLQIERSPADIIVGLSNLCPGSHEGYDREFAALYEVLKDLTLPPVLRRPVPVNRRTLDELPEIPYGDCAKGAYIEYRR